MRALLRSAAEPGIKDITPKGAKPPSNPDDAGLAAPTVSTQPSTGKTFDGTHLNPKGSAIVGAIVAGQLAAVVPDLAPYIKSL
jgi:lysophospholipase L1-like esterase